MNILKMNDLGVTHLHRAMNNGHTITPTGGAGDF